MQIYLCCMLYTVGVTYAAISPAYRIARHGHKVFAILNCNKLLILNLLQYSIVAIAIPNATVTGTLHIS